MPWIGGVELQRHDKQRKPSLRQKSIILSAITRYNDLHIIVDLANDFESRPSLPIFDKFPLASNNEYLLELVFILPDWLPCLDDEVEFVVDVLGRTGERHELCVSNQMVKLAFEVSGKPEHLLCPLPAAETARKHTEFGIPENAFATQLKSVVSMRFRINGKTARDAFEAHARNCIKEFISCINRFAMASMELTTPSNLPPIFPSYDPAHFDAAYFAMHASDNDQDAIIFRYATNVRHSLNYPYRSVADNQATIIRNRSAGLEQVDEIQSLLGSARSYNEGGLEQFALLLIVIGAEIATSRFFTRFLAKNGTSKNKQEDLEKELTYSMMLNLLPAICPDEMKPDNTLLASIIEARKKRNEFMHKGTFNVSSKWIKTAHEKTVEYVEFLHDAARSLNI